MNHEIIKVARPEF